jgi:hypothetical protein
MRAIYLRQILLVFDTAAARVRFRHCSGGQGSGPGAAKAENILSMLGDIYARLSGV